MRKVLIANRGEIACRIIRSCRDAGLSTVAVYSEADQDALHVSLADEAYLIGPGPARESYLVAEHVIDAAMTSKADAVHPGYGFLSENAEFAEAVAARNLIWIGPEPSTIRKMGDKEQAREIARSAGVPVLPGSGRLVGGNLDDIERMADTIGFPLLVKASAGGGGIGMKRVDHRDQLRPLAESTQKMAEKVFGDGAIYLEKYLPAARHVEIQIFGFGDGHAIHLYDRDCSLQRRFQKIVEEAPAPLLPETIRDEISEAACRLAREQNYGGAGTVEFIVDTKTFDFYFLEMNTRIQVEHPVTEMVTKCDLVSMQLELARGTLAHIRQEDVLLTGHAIECRLYAENPDRNFMPSPGTLTALRLPGQKDGIRIDSGFRAGDEISMFYDPMIAKIICHADTRSDAIAKMRRALDQTEVEGVKSNLAFLKRVLLHSGFSAGDVSTGFVDQHLTDLIGQQD